MSYNGWKNWETWNVALWVNNDESLYSSMRVGRPFTAETAQDFCMALFPFGTPDMERGREEMEGVDWQEVADDFNSD